MHVFFQGSFWKLCEREAQWKPTVLKPFDADPFMICKDPTKPPIGRFRKMTNSSYSDFDP